MRIVAQVFGKLVVIGALVVAATALLLDVGYLSASRAPALHVEEVGSDSTAFDVIATIVVGPTEALLWDTQYHASDARRLADRIAATKKHLVAIVISHPDHDHFAGAAIIEERFPGTPVYMTAAALDHFKQTGIRDFEAERSRRPGVLADSVIIPEVLPSTRLMVDGQTVEVIPDLTGDVKVPTNSILWIPSIKTVLAGDVVFNDVHPWLGDSDVASRAAWRASLERIAALHPTAVVAGHKKDVMSADTPDALTYMNHYLSDFDRSLKTATTPMELRAAMLQKYPDAAVSMLVGAGAMAAFRK
jgi:glyoxylase-like metal-dependent hydrolase (beta-lactamase superfamily II)